MKLKNTGFIQILTGIILGIIALLDKEVNWETYVSGLIALSFIGLGVFTFVKNKQP